MKRILSLLIMMSFILSTLNRPVSFAQTDLTLEYGDFYIGTNISITSQTVSGEGAALGDTAVVEITADGRLHAVGLGYATINDGGSEKKVTVNKADMALIMIAGQSNAAGDCSDYTMAPNATGEYEDRFFITNSMGCSLSTEFVTLDEAKYCAAHGGKMKKTNGGATDTRSAAAASALARKLVDLWDMKVWVVNSAVNGSKIGHWVPGGAFHQKFINYANTAKAEIESDGHYVLDESKLGYLWLQGCSDGATMSMADYITNFMKMHEAFKADAGMNYAGIWQVRAGLYNNGDQDFYMSGPRLAQYYMTNSSDSQYADIHMILDTDIWRYDANVKAYFENKYGTNEAFVARFGYDMPKTVNDIKPDLHYRQPGYNELGDEGAINLAKALAGEGDVTSATLKDYYGNPFGAEIKLDPMETITVVPVVSNLNYNASENLTLEVVDEKVASVSNTDYTLTGKSNGQTALKLCQGEKVLATYILFVGTGVYVPIEEQIKNCANVNEVISLLDDNLLNLGLDDYVTLYKEAFSDAERTKVAQAVYDGAPKTKEDAYLLFQKGVETVATPSESAGEIILFEDFEKTTGSTMGGATPDIGANQWTTGNTSYKDTLIVSEEKSLTGTKSYKTIGKAINVPNMGTSYATKPDSYTITLYVYDNATRNSLSNLTYDIEGGGASLMIGFDLSRLYNANWSGRVADSGNLVYTDTAGNSIARKKGWNRLVISITPNGTKVIINGVLAKQSENLKALVSASGFKITQRGGWGNDAATNAVYSDAVSIIKYNPPVISDLSLTQDEETGVITADVTYTDPAGQEPVYQVEWYASGELVATTNSLSYTPTSEDAGKTIKAVVSASNLYGTEGNSLEASIEAGVVDIRFLEETFEDKSGNLNGTSPQIGNGQWTRDSGRETETAYVKETLDRNGMATKALFFNNLSSGSMSVTYAPLPTVDEYVLSMWIYDEFAANSISNLTIDFANSFISLDPNAISSSVWRCRLPGAPGALNSDLLTKDGNPIPRSKGWHHLEIKVTDGVGAVYLDGIETNFSDKIEAITFKQHSGWTKGTVQNSIYIDDISITQPANTMPCRFNIVNFTDEEIKVRISANPTYENDYTAIVAVYERDVLVDVKTVKKEDIKDTASLTFSISKDSREIDVRAMIWNSAAGMVPLAKTEFLIKNGRTLVPFIEVIESVGAYTRWDEKTQTVTAMLDHTVVKLTAGEDMATVNGVETPLELPSEMKDGTVMAPLRFIENAFDCNVSWDSTAKKATAVPNKEVYKPSTDSIEKAPVAGYEGIVYKTINGKDYRLFVKYPSDFVEGEERPAILYFHGGSWRGGYPRNWTSAQHYVDQGFIVFYVHYRVESRDKIATPAPCIADGKSAMRFVRKNAGKLGVDPNRIVAAGMSAGAHVALSTGVIDGYNEPTDDLTIDPTPNAYILYSPVVDTTPTGFLGMLSNNVPAQTELSPLHQLDQKIFPVVIITGTSDPLYKSACAFDTKMDEFGAICQVFPFEGQGHTFTDQPDAETLAQFIEITDTFLIENNFWEQ